MKKSTSIKNRILSFRPEAALPIFGYVLLGAVLSGISNIQFIVIFLIGIGIVLATNSVSEAFDYKLDKVNRHKSQIIRRNVSRKSVLTQGIILYITSTIAGLYFFNISMILILFIIISLSIIQVHPRTYSKKYGFYGITNITLLFSLIFVLPLLVSKNYLNLNEIMWLILIFSNTFIAMICKDYKDYKGDKKMGIKTPVVILGTEKISKFIRYTIFIPLILASFYTILDYFTVFIVLLTILYLVKIKYVELINKDPIKNGKEIAAWGRIDRTLFPLMFAIVIILH